MARKKQIEDNEERAETTTEGTQFEGVAEQGRQEAIRDYQGQIQAVMDLKQLTDCEAWRSLYRHMTKMIDAHAVSILDAEKPREVVQHQEGVKTLRGLINHVKQPIETLNSFIASMPLFSAEFKTRAEWNTAMGKVELKQI